MMMLLMGTEQDEDERDEDPTDEDVARFSKPSSVRRCHECGADVSEVSDICPKCRAYQFDEDENQPARRRPRQQAWKFALVIAVLAVALALSGLLIIFVR